MPGTSGRQDQFSKQSQAGSISQAYSNGRSNLVVNTSRMRYVRTKTERRLKPMLGGEPASERLSYI
jgi:hypothetical protein